MENFIANNGLVVNNTGNNVTYYRHNASSIIDVIMSTPKLAQHIKHYQTIPFAPASDHIGICFALQLSSGNLTPKRNIRKMDLPGFSSNLEETSVECQRLMDLAEPVPGLPEVQRYMSTLDLEEGAIQLEKDFSSSMDKNTKIMSGRPQVLPVQWFNNKLTHLKNQMLYAANALAARKKQEKTGVKQRFNHKVTYDDFKKKRSQYKKAVRAKQRQFHRTDVVNTKTPTDVIKLGKKLNHVARHEMGLQADDNGHLLSPKESVDKVVNHFK